MTQDLQHARSWFSAHRLLAVLRGSLRRLFRSPAFAVAVVGTLGLGIGVPAAVFCVLDAVLLQPLPYPHAARLVRLRSAVPLVGPAHWGLAKGEFLFFRENISTLEGVGLYRLWSATATGAGAACSSAHEVLTAQTSAGLAEVLGLQRPTHGRLPQRLDEKGAKPDVAWLGHDYWHRCFAADPAVVGDGINLDGAPVLVAGVLPPWVRLPEEARSPELRVDVWVPLHLDPAEPAVRSHVFRAIGRLSPAASREAAEADLRLLTARLPQALPEAYTAGFMEQTGFTTEVVPLRDDIVEDVVADMLWVLFGSCGLVLVVGFANAANISLARAAGHQRDTAIRAALGASRARLAIDSFIDSLLLAHAAGIMGLAIATLATRLLLELSPPGLPRLGEIEVGWSVMIFAWVLSVIVGVALGALPLFGQSLRVSLVLRQAGHDATPSRRQHFVRHALVVGQAALSLLLLSGALLLFRSIQNLLSIPPGIEAEGVLTFRIALPEARYETHASSRFFYRRLTDQLQSIPGIESAGLASALPFTGFDGCSSVYTDATIPIPERPPPCMPFFLISPGYLEALRVPLQGRSLDWSDLEQRHGVAVASRAAAQRLWPDRDAVGEEFRGSRDTAPYRIVGIAGDILANGLDEPPIEALYLPLSPSSGAELWPPIRNVMVVVKVESRSLETVVPLIRRVLTNLDSEIPITDLRPMSEVLLGSMVRLRFLATLVSFASLVTLLLTSLGIYGLLSYMVSLRRSELGIRLALGCGREQLQRLVVGHALRLAAVGVGIGLVGALPAVQLLRTYLFEVHPIDPIALGIASLALMTVAAAAAWGPAARAGRVPPSETLRGQ